MRKKIIGLSILICCLLLSGCSRKGETSVQILSNYNSNAGNADGIVEDPSKGSDISSPAEPGEEPVEEALSLRIVDGAEDGNLLLAGEGYDSVYRIFLRSARREGGTDVVDISEIPVYLDGQPADAADLEDGMMVDIVFQGGVMESFPAQIGQITSVSAYSRGTARNPGGNYYDLCGFYLQVLNDLWDVDEGLNGGAKYVSVDLSEAPGGLTEGEKMAVAWRFAELHQVESLMLSYEELLQEGYLTKVDLNEEYQYYYWEDGLLFSITAREEAEVSYSLPVLRFDAEKWRTPLGAYSFWDCTAVWPEMGTWSNYQIGAEMIS